MTAPTPAAPMPAAPTPAAVAEPDAPAPDDPATPASTALGRQLLFLLANVTVLTALLVYFGYTRAEAHGARLGVDVQLLGMSVQDYALRSVGAVLAILLVVAAVGVLCVFVDRGVRAGVARLDAAGRRRLRWLPAVPVGLAIAAPLLVTLTQDAWPAGAYMAYPAVLGISVLLLAYAVVLVGLLRGTGRPGSPTARLMVGFALGVCVFWAAGNIAVVEGHGLADKFRRDRDAGRVTKVVVFSKALLGLSNVEETDLLDGRQALVEGGYRYRSGDLLLVDHIGNKYFLLPQNSQQPVRLIVLTEDPGLRFEFETVVD